MKIIKSKPIPIEKKVLSANRKANTYETINKTVRLIIFNPIKCRAIVPKATIIGITKSE